MIGPVPIILFHKPLQGGPAQVLRPNPGIPIGVQYGEQHRLPFLLDLQQIYTLLDTISE
jgi:hypothetical protein